MVEKQLTETPVQLSNNWRLTVGVLLSFTSCN